jgi:Tfp pilus assembly PilM family ATPase
MKLFSRDTPPQVIGLDIGLSEIKAVQLARNSNGQVQLVAYGEYPLPDTSIDPIMYPSSYLSALSSLLQSPRLGNFTGTHFAVGLPARHTLLKSKVNTTAFTDMASKELHVDPSALHIQTIFTGGSAYPIGIASLRSTIDPHLAALNAYKPVLSSEHELAAAARTINVGTEHTLLIDFGSKQTVIGSYYYHLREVMVLGTGVNNLIQTFAQKNSLKEHEAAEILYSFGLQTSTMQLKIREAIKPLVAELATQIRMFLDAQPNSIDKIVLFGGGACIPAFASYIARFLDHSVEVANPWETTDIYPLKPMPRRIAPKFSVAVGLALLGLR